MHSLALMGAGTALSIQITGGVFLLCDDAVAWMWHDVKSTQIPSSPSGRRYCGALKVCVPGSDFNIFDVL
jgi:hypothetical protein